MTEPATIPALINPAPYRPRRHGSALVLLVLALIVAALVAIGLVAARNQVPPAAGLSTQVSGIPPLQNLIQDQGNSIALPDGRTLWIFADTAQLNARPRFFVTSSAGIASGTNLRLRYLTDRHGTPIEFLPRNPDEKADQVGGQHYTAIWPTGATALPDGRIIIAYAKYAVRMSPKVAFDFVAGGLFSYRYPGWNTAPGHTGLVGADDGDQPANRFADDIWTPADGPIASPVYADGYVYFSRCEQFRCYSVRSTVPGLADRSGYRWWTGSGWSPDAGRRARVVFGSDVPGRNPSIGWSEPLGLFVIADTSGGIQSTKGLLWVARNPWGPWSKAAPFALPQCPTGGCYTLNVHPDRSPPGTVRVSFATSGIGPYVRVVDVPVRVTRAGSAEAGSAGSAGAGSTGADVPQIRTHDDGLGCTALTLSRCPKP